MIRYDTKTVTFKIAIIIIVLHCKRMEYGLLIQLVEALYFILDKKTNFPKIHQSDACLIVQ